MPSAHIIYENVWKLMADVRSWSASKAPACQLGRFSTVLSRPCFLRIQTIQSVVSRARSVLSVLDFTAQKSRASLQSAPNTHVHPCTFALRCPQSCLRLGSLVVITLIDLSSCCRVTGYQTRDPITMQIKVSWENGCKSSFIALSPDGKKSPHWNPIISLIVSSSYSVLGEATGRV